MFKGLFCDLKSDPRSTELNPWKHVFPTDSQIHLLFSITNWSHAELYVLALQCAHKLQRDRRRYKFICPEHWVKLLFFPPIVAGHIAVFVTDYGTIYGTPHITITIIYITIIFYYYYIYYLLIILFIYCYYITLIYVTIILLHILLLFHIWSLLWKQMVIVVILSKN